jgi:hypothetical protein
MRAERKFLTRALATVSLALPATLMTSEAVLAASTGNTRPAAMSSTPGATTKFGSRDSVTLVFPSVLYDARPSSIGFGRTTRQFSHNRPGTVTITTKPIVHDHRKGSDFGKEGSNRYPPAGTNGGPLPTSGSIVRDHRGEPHPYTITQTTEYAPGNPNPRTVKSFRTGTGMTVTVKSPLKPVCLGNMCWLTEWRPF